MWHVFMAACWLIFGGVLLAWQWSDPAVPRTSLWGTGIPLGWLAIAMALYNLLRWWMGHSYKSARRALQESPPRRHAPEQEQSQPAPAPDPNFDFTTQPPQPR